MCVSLAGLMFSFSEILLIEFFFFFFLTWVFFSSSPSLSLLPTVCSQEGGHVLCKLSDHHYHPVEEKCQR